jgi:TonB family protein
MLGCVSTPSKNLIDPNKLQFVNFSSLEKISQLDLNDFYPSKSKELKEEGTVGVFFLINEKGNAVGPIIINSSGYPNLDNSAKEVVKKLIFKPYLINGEPTYIRSKMTVEFALPPKDDSSMMNNEK